MIKVWAFRTVPPVAQGLVRDLRVRWALEEAGLPYAQQLIGREEQASESYRKLQPFSQVPVMQDGDLTLFESGAIALYIAEQSETLLPRTGVTRQRAIAWVFAALNSVETFVQGLAEIDLFHGAAEWAAQRRPQLEAATRNRLGQLATCLDRKEYLEGTFTVGDLMMATVLRILRHTSLITADPILGPYLERCESRPAFRRALNAQLSAFSAH